jgi:hypothetical protein
VHPAVTRAQTWFERAIETALIYAACIAFCLFCWAAVIRWLWKLVF